MESEFTPRPEQSPTELKENPASPPSTGKNVHEAEFLGEASRLQRTAENETRKWRSPVKHRDHRWLRQRWSDAQSSIQRFYDEAKQRKEGGRTACYVTSPLTAHARLIATALRGTHESMEVADDLPQVRVEGLENIPRAYATAASYLAACHYEFQESSLVTFLRGVQKVQSFKICELRALKTLLQLVLLHEIGSAIRESLEHNAGIDSSRVTLFVTCLKAIEHAPWKEIFRQLSEVDHILRGDPAGAYSRMDPESQALYIQHIEDLGRFSETGEPEIARRVIALARTAQREWNSNPRIRERRSHAGFYLIDKGREWLENQIRYRPPFARRVRETILSWPELYYFVGIELLTFATIAFLLIGARAPESVIAGFLLLLLPATDAAWGVMNRVTAFLLPPRVLPKLDFSEGIPADCATLVVIPTLLTSEAYVHRMVREIEIRYLANRDANLYFALLTDSPDSPDPIDQNDELVGLCAGLIQELNRKYSRHGREPFLFFHRYRTFNPREGAWMGWERKRGKILDLNKLLRAGHDSFPVKVGDLSVLPKIEYVITLDSDTQLPRTAAARLIGTLAHPLNRAVIDSRTNTVVEGYGLLQPRVGISVRSAGRSLLAALFSGQTGLDPYTHAISDVYQDLFSEGNFAGKGIYEVDIFRQVLEERFPHDAILSHDLIEGTYTRAGLVSDIEVIDDYPTHFRAHSRRKHRWVRGDWQILGWLFPRVPDASGKKTGNPLSLVSRWKILDNLRRSLQEIATFILFLAGWFSLPGSPRRWTLATLVLLLIPAYLELGLAFLRMRPGQLVRRLKETAETFITEQISVFFTLAFLSHQMLVNLDAIIRTLVRVTITKRKLLEWETAAEAEAETRSTPVDLYLAWTPWLSLAIAAALAFSRPTALPVAAPLLILWACSGSLAHWLDQPLRPGKTTLSSRDEEFLRGLCLHTWHYFQQTAAQEGAGLVPDRLQEVPALTAHKISPTNLGMQLDAQLAAYELGYLTLPEFVQQAEETLTAAQRLRRFEGHFLNWYDTRTFEPLEPWFVSSVDSGNLACSLWVLKQGCLTAMQEPLLRSALWQGLYDHLNLLAEMAERTKPAVPPVVALRKIGAQADLLRDHGNALTAALPALEQTLRSIAGDISVKSEAGAELRWWTVETLHRAEAIRKMLDRLVPWLSGQNRGRVEEFTCSAEGGATELTLSTLATAVADWGGKLEEFAASPKADPVSRLTAQTLLGRLPASLAAADDLLKRLAFLAEEADRLVQEMNFRFLFNPRRELLSIGYDVKRRHWEENDYDLLASEARSAVFVAIAKGDIPQESWFRLGRAHFLCGSERVLASWSGTMFEYLMPALWFKRFPHTVLDQSLRAAVRCQKRWAESQGIPWGVSEAAYNSLDTSGFYQYRAFGMPSLALNRDSPQDVVVSPYSTFLALAVDPLSAVRNLEQMAKRGWLGRWGFYEAADFTPARVRSPEGYELVRCWMAHHQGMSLLAGCNLLAEGALQNLFHAEPAVAATELLLHERLRFATTAERSAGANSRK